MDIVDQRYIDQTGSVVVNSGWSLLEPSTQDLQILSHILDVTVLIEANVKG